MQIPHIENRKQKERKNKMKNKADFAFYTDNGKKLKEFRSKEEKIEVKEGTKVISSLAFCTPNAKEIVLPDSVEVVQTYAFENCRNLQKVVFGKGIKRIYPDIFRGCDNLSEIEFAVDKDPDFVFEGGDTNGRAALRLGLTQFLIHLTVRSQSALTLLRNSDYNFQLYDSLTEKFLKTKIPQMTIKITAGEKSLRLPVHVPKYKDYMLDDILRDWLKEIYSSAFYDRLSLLTSLVEDSDANYALALELYLLDGDRNALKYLKASTYSEMIHICESGKYEMVKNILELEFFTATELKSLIQYLSENNMTEAMAYVMEYVKKGRFKVDFSL